MSDNGIVDYEGEKVDEMAIVDFISKYFIQKFAGCNYPAEVVRQIMAKITEVIVEKYSAGNEEQERLPLDVSKKNYVP
ncbi:MAG: hypothetical protein AAB757_00135 [Patescibacteria group bacterium]